MPGVGSVAGRASHRLAVDGQRPPPAGGRFGAPRSPGADGGVQLVAVQPLQRAADSRLTRRAPTCLQRHEDLLRGVGRPSPIAANERQPASTAHTASPTITVIS
jgi:hypothetical protein